MSFQPHEGPRPGPGGPASSSDIGQYNYLPTFATEATDSIADRVTHMPSAAPERDRPRNWPFESIYNNSNGVVHNGLPIASSLPYNPSANIFDKSIAPPTAYELPSVGSHADYSMMDARPITDNGVQDAVHPDFSTTSQGVPVPSEIQRSRYNNDAMSISALLSSDHEQTIISAETPDPSYFVQRRRSQASEDLEARKRPKSVAVDSDIMRKKETKRKSAGDISCNTRLGRGDDYVHSDDSGGKSDDDAYMVTRFNYERKVRERYAKAEAQDSQCAKRRRIEVHATLTNRLEYRVKLAKEKFSQEYYKDALARVAAEELAYKEEVEAIAAHQKAKLQTPVTGDSLLGTASIRRSQTHKRKKRESSLPLTESETPEPVDDEFLPAEESQKATAKKLSSSFKGIEDLQTQIWKDIARKEVPKVYRMIQTNQTNRSINQRKTVQLCAKEARRWQFRTNKTVKDMQAKAKRAMREMLVFWKRNEREERSGRQRAEKETVEKAKKDEELRESRRQARKLNFLISQTELYSHFIGRKIKTDEAEQSEDTTTDATPALTGVPQRFPDMITGLGSGVASAPPDFDADDDDALHLAAARNAQEAVQKAKEKAQSFDLASGARTAGAGIDQDSDAMELDFQNPNTLGQEQVAQPKMLNATLKEYQLKGLNWLVNLYEQGINGILADEMGLGKTVQSIAVMAYLAETYNIWGPFLVIAPASTLHNWQQEITKFVPRLKALPYWGSTKDRKVLRKFWDRKRMTYTEDSPFHVLITSYQLVVQDAQYFAKVKWQYMILDEAQAIKSSQSSRWKSLLGFHCRNRLLLTGTPIQNTMQELWALLHFIMPSLFDSHDEFSEWFSKDIESHAQSNTQLNEEQLKRLHMILKPFMLRRVKKNVQKELGEKIELEVFCELNSRQRRLYRSLRQQISIKDIIERASSGSDENISSLMNLVMQFRKVCNHPDLFERADVSSPYAFVDFPQATALSKEGKSIEYSYGTSSLLKYHVPKLLYRQGGFLDVPSAESSAGFERKYLRNLFNIFTPDYINQSLKGANTSPFAVLRLTNCSLSEAASEVQDSLYARLLFLYARSIRLGRTRSSFDGYFSRRVEISGLTVASKLRIMRQRDSDSVLSSLCSIGDLYVREQLLHRLDPLYEPRVLAPPVEITCSDRTFFNEMMLASFPVDLRQVILPCEPFVEDEILDRNLSIEEFLPLGGLLPPPDLEKRGYNKMSVPSMRAFITDSGKLSKLDELLTDLKANDHRILLYFQMTRMIDLMEEYLIYKQYKYLRLDGSSKISDRRDMVNDWQTRPDLFVFLLSTRAGGLGINLTAADTVIFYDSDWNPTIDSQAMDRAHRLGQTKQVTVYRLITRGTIEERILGRAKQKEEVQKVVISGGDYKQSGSGGVDFSTQRGPRDVVSWLLDDESLEKQVLEATERNAVRKKNKGRKIKALDEVMNLEDMYHEGEGNFESGRNTGLATPEEGEAPKKAGPKRKVPVKDGTVAKRRPKVAVGES